MSASKCFTLKEEIQLVKDRDYTNVKLTAIFLNDKIVPSADVVADIVLLKVWCMKRYMLQVKNSSNMPAEKKILLMREAQLKIMELEKK